MHSTKAALGLLGYTWSLRSGLAKGRGQNTRLALMLQKEVANEKVAVGKEVF